MTDIVQSIHSLNGEVIAARITAGVALDVCIQLAKRVGIDDIDGMIRSMRDAALDSLGKFQFHGEGASQAQRQEILASSKLLIEHLSSELAQRHGVTL